MEGWTAIPRTGAAGNALAPDPMIGAHVMPPSVVFQSVCPTKPSNPAYTVVVLRGSTASRPTCRPLGIAMASTFVHVGRDDVPFVVFQMSPLLCPTYMMLELPGATAIALTQIALQGPDISVLIRSQLGPVSAVLAVFTSFVRQRPMPPASSVLGLFGSRMNGAMKFAAPKHVSSSM